MRYTKPEALLYMNEKKQSFLALNIGDEVVWYKNVKNGWEGVSVKKAKKVAKRFKKSLEKEMFESLDE